MFFTAVSANGFESSIISMTEYTLDGTKPGGEHEIWVEDNFSEPVVYNVKEWRFRSPTSEPFSVDFSGFKDAENEREQLKALFNWHGIVLSVEEGSATNTIKENFSSDNQVVMGDALATSCLGSAYNCIDKVAVVPGTAVNQDYQMLRVAYSWVNQGMLSMVGIMHWKYDFPALLSRSVYDVDSTRGSWSSNKRKYWQHFEDTETWGSIIDPNAQFSFKGLFFGTDAATYRLNQARYSGEEFHYGFTGRMFTYLGNYTVTSSGQSEQLLNETYGTDFDTAEEMSELTLGFDFNLGVMGVITIPQAAQIFVEAGIRANGALVDSDGELPSSKHRYEFESMGVTKFQGTYLSAGVSF